MGIKYKVITTYKPGKGKTGKPISFPKITGGMKMNLRDVSKILAERSSLSEGDVYAVVVGLVNLIPEMLMNGYTIKLDGLGSFRLHAKVTPEENPEDVNVRNIKGLRISFRPDNEIKNELHTKGITKVHK